MPDYSKGKIYKIISSECDDVYYGSTVLPLNDRLSKHERSYKQYLNGNYGCNTSFKIIEKGNYEIVLVENYQCNSRKELEMREGEYIKNNQCVNRIVPRRTVKEYYEDNKEKISEQNKEKNCCEFCGRFIRKYEIRRHQRTKKCLSYQHQHDDVTDCF